jgi:hypothetical protein
MKEDIIKLAREAGFTNPERFETDDENLRGILEDFWVNLERFAAIVANRCAEIAYEAEPFHSADLIRKAFGERND